VQLELYGTVSCHLCDEAKAVLQGACVCAAHIDIAVTEELLEKYGMRIPVLRRVDSGAELGWPFDAAAVTRFLARSAE
jgi:hypothetical protein